MFDSNSRYFGIEQASYIRSSSDGTEHVIKYVRRRFIPAPAARTVLAERTVAEGDRLDLITAQYFGDPTQFWHLCDANGVLDPSGLEHVGAVIQVTMPVLEEHLG